MLYAPSVPVFLHCLARPEGLAARAEHHAAAHGLADAQVLQARLAPDMLPFAAQVRTAAHFALPNFLFHLVSAYNILRHPGVPLGKADFDGLHLYAPVR